MSACLLALLTKQIAYLSELQKFVTKSDCATTWSTLTHYVYRRGDRVFHYRQISLNSQIWKGAVWKHRIVIVEPDDHAKNDRVALLLVTGGSVNERDIDQARDLANLARRPAILVFDIPNQPLWSLREDELIAHSFDRYLATGDSSWPLLLPMVKSSLSAMEAVTSVQSTTSRQLEKFVLAGASKRGWTTWLAAATGDPRIIGIAPMVYDNLNIPAQMQRQIERWGSYSPMIEAYTKRGLQRKVGTARGSKLAEMIDPYSYRAKLTMPKLIITGSNDPYWTVDAMSAYWASLPSPRSALIVPNAGHEAGDSELSLRTLGLFVRSCAGEFVWPEWDAVQVGESIVCASKSPFLSAGYWGTDALPKPGGPARWTWHPVELPMNGGNRISLLSTKDNLRAAVIPNLRFEVNVDGKQEALSLSAPPIVLLPSKNDR